jgi:hypothetical protein
MRGLFSFLLPLRIASVLVVGEGVLYGSRLSLVAPPICNARPGVSRIARSYRSLCRSWVVACEDTLTSLYRVVSAQEVRARAPALILRSCSHEKPRCLTGSRSGSSQAKPTSDDGTADIFSKRTIPGFQVTPSRENEREPEPKRTCSDGPVTQSGISQA